MCTFLVTVNYPFENKHNEGNPLSNSFGHRISSADQRVNVLQMNEIYGADKRKLYSSGECLFSLLLTTPLMFNKQAANKLVIFT